MLIGQKEQLIFKYAWYRHMSHIKTNAGHYNAIEEDALNSIKEGFLKEVIFKVALNRQVKSLADKDKSKWREIIQEQKERLLKSTEVQKRITWPGSCKSRAHSLLEKGQGTIIEGLMCHTKATVAGKKHRGIIPDLLFRKRECMRLGNHFYI